MNARQATIFSIGCMVCAVLPVFLIGALSVQITDEYGLGRGVIGLFVGAFYMTCTVTSISSGRLVDRYGYASGLRWSTLMGAIALCGVPVASLWTWWVIVPFLVVAAIGNTISQVATTVLIAQQVPADRQGFSFGLRQSARPLATFLGGLAVPLLALRYSWRYAFLGGGVFAIGLYFHALKVALADRATRPMIARGPRPIRATQSGQVNRMSMALLSSCIMLGAASGGALAAFFVSSSVDTGYGEGAAGVLLAGGSVIGFLVRLVAGWIADRRPNLQVVGVTIMFLLGAVGYLLLSLGDTRWIPVGAVLAFGAGTGWSGVFVLVVVRANRSAPGTASGITQTGGYIGAAIGPIAFGAVASWVDLRSAWMVMAVVTAAAAAFLVVAKPLRAAAVSTS